MPFFLTLIAAINKCQATDLACCLATLDSGMSVAATL